jgi:histidine decarboxylase
VRRASGLPISSPHRRNVSFGPEGKHWIDCLPEAVFSEGRESVSAPSRSPAGVYPEIEGLAPQLFEIPASGLTQEQHAAALEAIRQYHARQRSCFLGFQANQDGFSHLAGLEPYLQCQLNNLGDPFKEGNFTLNSKWLERAVLDYYASLWNARWPHDRKDPESYWGYVLSMGSTEGNLYGLWNAREYLSGGALMADPEAEEEARRASLDGFPRQVRQRLVFTRPARPAENPNAFTPVMFYSQDTHYSILKAVRALRIKTFSDLGNQHYPLDNPLAPGRPWPKEVPSVGGDGGPGSIDVDALAALVEFFARRGHPILVFFNYGTTFKGAYDDVEAAGEALMPIFEAYGLVEREVVPEPAGQARREVRNGYWFHVDGALGAAYMPFLEMAYNTGRIPHRGPNFDFRLPYVHSLVMSGHKWIGAPWPCGIFMTRTKLQMMPPDDPEYVGTPDTTFAGSRNGFSALLLWSYAAQNSYEAQIARALATEEVARYAHDQLRRLEDRLGRDLWVERTSPCSLTIRFKAASPAIRRRYSLSGETLYVEGVAREYSHIFAMPHVTKELIDALVENLAEDGAIPEQRPAVPREQAPTEAFEDDDAGEPGLVAIHETVERRSYFYFAHVGRSFR